MERWSLGPSRGWSWVCLSFGALGCPPFPDDPRTVGIGVAPPHRPADRFGPSPAAAHRSARGLMPGRRLGLYPPCMTVLQRLRTTRVDATLALSFVAVSLAQLAWQPFAG